MKRGKLKANSYKKLTKWKLIATSINFLFLNMDEMI